MFVLHFDVQSTSAYASRFVSIRLFEALLIAYQSQTDEEKWCTRWLFLCFFCRFGYLRLLVLSLITLTGDCHEICGIYPAITFQAE